MASSVHLKGPLESPAFIWMWDRVKAHKLNLYHKLPENSVLHSNVHLDALDLKLPWNVRSLKVLSATQVTWDSRLNTIPLDTLQLQTAPLTIDHFRLLNFPIRNHLSGNVNALSTHTHCPVCTAMLILILKKWINQIAISYGNWRLSEVAFFGKKFSLIVSGVSNRVSVFFKAVIQRFIVDKRICMALHW